MIVEIDKRAIKDLSKLDKHTSDTILDKIESLENFPNTSNIKRLINFTPRYRMRVGDYRVLFDIKNEVLTVYKVQHRKKIY